MKQEYTRSRIIIVISTIIISLFAFKNEEDSVRMFATVLFTIVSLIASFLGTKVSMLMIKIGDKISNRLLAMAYYTCLPIIFISLILLMWAAMSMLLGCLPETDEFGTAIGQALFFVMWAIAVAVFIAIPYIQTIIVLGLRRITGNR